MKAIALAAMLTAGPVQATTYVVWDEAVDGDMAADGSSFDFKWQRPGDILLVKGYLTQGDVDGWLVPDLPSPDNVLLISISRNQPSDNIWKFYVPQEAGPTVGGYFWSMGCCIANPNGTVDVGPIEYTYSYEMGVIPLPAGAVLLVSGLGLLGFARRKRIR